MLIMREIPSNSLRMIDSLTARSAPPSTTEMSISLRFTLWNWFCSTSGADHWRKAITPATQRARPATAHAPRRNIFCFPLLWFVIFKKLFRCDQRAGGGGLRRRGRFGGLWQVAVIQPEFLFFGFQNAE